MLFVFPSFGLWWRWLTACLRLLAAEERMQKEDVIRSEQEQGKSSLADAVADTNMSDVVGVDDMG